LSVENETETGSELSALPHIDEHLAVVNRGGEQTWESLLRVVETTFASNPAPRLTRLLGCADTAVGGPRPLAVGSTLPGFHVTEFSEMRRLVLCGRHRFSRYALVFVLKDLGEGRTRLGAETRAEFPELKGSVYRALVIGTRIHVLVTHRILAAVKRRASQA